jgi:orotate phosphoribosyltransferase
MLPLSRARLLELVRSRAFSFGDFTLASGKKSTYYINSKKILFHSESVALIGEAFAEQLRDLDIQAVGGLEIGAIPLATACVLQAHHEGRSLEGFVVRKQAKGHGSQERIEGVLPAGARVAIVDDVLTTGGSALQAFEEVSRAGAVVVAVLCIVDRLEGAREVFEPRCAYRPLFTIRDFGVEPAKAS